MRNASPSEGAYDQVNRRLAGFDFRGVVLSTWLTMILAIFLHH
jgi:hypothetical protein